MNNNSFSKAVCAALNKSLEQQNKIQEQLKPIIEQQNRIQEYLKPFIEQQKRMQEQFKPLIEQQEKIQEYIRPIIEYQSVYENIIRESICTFRIEREQQNSRLIGVTNFFKAIEILGKSQYVYWHDLSKDVINEIIAAESIDKEMENTFLDTEIEVYSIVNNLAAHHLMIRHNKLLLQTYDAMKSGHYCLSVIGLISIFDGLLTYITGGLHYTYFKTFRRNL